MSVLTTFTAPSMNLSGTQYATMAQWLSNSLLACGLVRVASSKPAVAGGGNQAADYTGATPPGTTNTDADWEIWRLGDSLHSTCPIYFKFTWRVGSSTSTPNLKFAVGTGWDSVSAVNGQTFAEVTLANNGISATATFCFVAGSTNRVVVALWAAPDAPAANSFIIFGIERLHNADGSDNDEGAFVFAEHGGTNTNHYNQVISRPSFGANGALETKLGNVLLPRSTNSIYAGNAAVGLIFPMRGKALYPSRNFFIAGKGDLGAGGGVVTLDHYYGVPQKWYNCARGQTLPFDSSNSLSYGTMSRFE